MTMKIILISLISFLLIGEIGEGGDIGDTQNSSTYRTLVDGYKGFFRVADQRTGMTVPFENHTLYINKGDTVVWINDDTTDSFTIISDEKLWRDDKGKLKSTGKRISYTFNKSGTYTFRTNYKKFEPQTIIVNLSGNTDINVTKANSTINNDITSVMVNKTIAKYTPVQNKVANLNNSNVNNTRTYIGDNDTTTNNKDPIVSTNFFEPLNILKIFKSILMITLATITIMFLFKGNGGEES